jgi:predicted dehydrogenase
MNHFLPRALIATAVLGGLAAPAAAGSTAVVAVTLDTAYIEVGGGPLNGNATNGFYPPFSVDLAEGDSFDLTIDFEGGQTVTLDGLDSIWAYSFATVGTQVQGTGKFQFLGTDGSVLLESAEKTSVEGTDHFGQIFMAEDFANLPASITFGGVRYVGTVVDYIDPAVTSRTYDAAGFAFGADAFTTVVPEPGTWALMLAGAGVLAAAVRRRG